MRTLGLKSKVLFFASPNAHRILNLYCVYNTLKISFIYSISLGLIEPKTSQRVSYRAGI